MRAKGDLSCVSFYWISRDDVFTSNINTHTFVSLHNINGSAKRDDRCGTCRSLDMCCMRCSANEFKKSEHETLNEFTCRWWVDERKNQRMWQRKYTIIMKDTCYYRFLAYEHIHVPIRRSTSLAHILLRRFAAVRLIARERACVCDLENRHTKMRIRSSARINTILRRCERESEIIKLPLRMREFWKYHACDVSLCR